LIKHNRTYRHYFYTFDMAANRLTPEML